MENKIERIEFYGILLFIFCYFIQIFDMPNMLTVPIATIFCVLMIVKQKKVRFDLELFLLILTLGFYFIKDLGIIKALTSPYCYVAVIMYFLAHYIACETVDKENQEKQFITFLLIMVVAVTLHGLLNSYIFLDGQFYDGTERTWKDIWSENYMPGTLQVAYYLPAFALLFPAITYFKERKLCNIFLITSAIFLVYVSIASESRMSVVILPIVFLIQFLIYVFSGKRNFRNYFTSSKNLITIGILLVVGIFVAIFFTNSSVGKNFISIMGRNGGIFNNIRFQIQRRALEQIFVYPMGGNYMDHLGFAHTHNAWLDIADIGGVIPFFSFILYTVYTLREVVKLVIRKNISLELKCIVTGLYLVYFLFFTIEPALDYSVHFIVPWLFLHGLIHGYLRTGKKINE